MDCESLLSRLNEEDGWGSLWKHFLSPNCQVRIGERCGRLPSFLPLRCLTPRMLMWQEVVTLGSTGGVGLGE